MIGPVRGWGEEITAVSFGAMNSRSRLPAPADAMLGGNSAPRGTSFGPAEVSTQLPRAFKMVSSQRGIRVIGTDLRCGRLAGRGTSVNFAGDTSQYTTS